MSGDAPVTLVDFLLDRIAEDEDYATIGGHAEAAQCICSTAGHTPACPCRWLAECEAKRGIVEQCQMTIDSFGDWDATPGSRPLWEGVSRRERSHAHGRLRALASIYADHPAYREEWRP